MGKGFKYTGCALVPCSTLLPDFDKQGAGTDPSHSHQEATSNEICDGAVSRAVSRTPASVGETSKGRWP